MDSDVSELSSSIADNIEQETEPSGPGSIKFDDGIANTAEKVSTLQSIAACKLQQCSSGQKEMVTISCQKGLKPNSPSNVVECNSDTTKDGCMTSAAVSEEAVLAKSIDSKIMECNLDKASNTGSLAAIQDLVSNLEASILSKRKVAKREETTLTAHSIITETSCSVTDDRGSGIEQEAADATRKINDSYMGTSDIIETALESNADCEIESSPIQSIAYGGEISGCSRSEIAEARAGDCEIKAAVVSAATQSICSTLKQSKNDDTLVEPGAIMHDNPGPIPVNLDLAATADGEPSFTDDMNSSITIESVNTLSTNTVWETVPSVLTTNAALTEVAKTTEFSSIKTVNAELEDTAVRKPETETSSSQSDSLSAGNDSYEPKKKRCRLEQDLTSSDIEENATSTMHPVNASVTPKRKWLRKAPSRGINKFTGKRELRVKTLGKETTHLECFMQFFDIPLMRLILDMTNKNARRRISADVVDESEWLITEREILAYFGLRIMLGLMRSPTSFTFWRKREWFLDYATPFEIMSRDRFNFITRYLHFCDEEQAPDPSDSSADKFYQIRPLLDQLIPQFESAYSPGQNLTMSETQILSKAKVLVLSELETGYVTGLQFYTGRRSGMKPEFGLSKQAMRTLVSPIAGSWHRLYLGNFYSTPSLVEYLLKVGVYACGTIRQDQRDFPKRLLLDVESGRKAWGFSDWRASGPLLIHSWLDDKPVYFISNFHLPTYSSSYKGKKTVLRRGTRCSEENTKAKGYWKANEVYCPPMLQDYRSKTGAVDLGNQIRRYRCVFSFLLEVAVTNSRVLYDRTRNTSSSSLDFRQRLSRMLIGIARVSCNPTKLFYTCPAVDRLGLVKHFPQEIETKGLCEVCKVKKTDSLTSMKCKRCDVHLCVKQDSVCWENWHTKLEFW